MIMEYESKIGKRIREEISSKQITSIYEVELEERVISREKERYQHLFSTQLYGILENHRRKLFEKPIEEEIHHSPDGETLAQVTLEFVVKNLKDNPLHGRKMEFTGPTNAKEKIPDVYISILTIKVI